MVARQKGCQVFFSLYQLLSRKKLLPFSFSALQALNEGKIIIPTGR